MSSQAPRRSLIAAIVVAVLAAVLGAAAGVPTRATYGAMTTADEPQYLLTAISLAEDRDLDISDELAAERWRAFHEAQLPQQTRELADGVRISPHDPLLPVLLAPAVGAAGWRGGPWTLVVLAGALAGLLVWTAVRRLGVRPWSASLVVGTLGASVPLAAYGSEVYPELPAALAVAIGLAALLRDELRGREVAVVAVAVVALPWLAVKYAPVALVLAITVAARLYRDGRTRDLAVLVGALALAGVSYLGIHRSIWTGWTVYASGDHFVESGEMGVIGFTPDFVGRGVRLTALLVERRFGIATWQPGWLLLLPALGAWIRHRRRGRALVLSTLLAGWLTATFVALTMAGWWFPGRQVVVVLPAAVLVVAVWVDRARARIATFACLGVLGIASWLWLTVESSTGALTFIVDFYDTTNPLVRAWRTVLPDFQEVTATTWWLHGVWVGGCLGLLYLGWRGARPAADVPTQHTTPRTSVTA